MKTSMTEELKTKTKNIATIFKSKKWIDFKTTAWLIGKKNFGRNKMMKFLRDIEVLTDYNTPYNEYVKLGYFREVQYSISKEGRKAIISQTLVSRKGIDFIIWLITD